jgi:hypothetical protein
MGKESLQKNSDAPEKEKISNEDFNEQFVVQKVSVEGHEFEFVKVMPPEKISEQFVVFIGGFGAGAEEYKAEIEDLAKSGRKVFFINPLKGMEARDNDIQTMEAFAIPDTIQMKTAEVLKALEIAGIQRADFVGHSQGAIVAAMISSLRPGIAENLVLTNPAGMHGEDSRGALMARTVSGLGAQQVENAKRMIREEGELKRISSVAGTVVSGTEIHKSPLWRFTEEIPGIVNSNIIPVLKNLKERQETLTEEEKTKITLVTANADRTFSPERIDANLGVDSDNSKSVETLFKEVLDSSVMYVEKNAGHEAPIYEKAGLAAQIVNEKILNRELNENRNENGVSSEN